MQYTIFIEELKRKFSYSDKLVRTLDKIFPMLVSYYGKEHLESIKEALSNTKIIECNSYQTVPIALKEVLPDGNISCDASSGGIYASSPKIVYYPVISSYVIPKVSRYIILSHTYNLDAISGLSFLTEQLCRLVRSYNNEYQLNGDHLLVNNGICRKNYLLKQESYGVTSNLVKTENFGLEEGFVSYDTENIVSMIVNDNYHHFSCEFGKKIASIIYKNLKLKDIVLSSLFSKDIDMLTSTYDVMDGLFSNLSALVDQGYELEQKSLRMDITRQEKIELRKELSLIIDMIAQNMSFYLKSIKKETPKNLGS